MSRKVEVVQSSVVQNFRIFGSDKTAGAVDRPTLRVPTLWTWDNLESLECVLYDQPQPAKNQLCPPSADQCTEGGSTLGS